MGLSKKSAGRLYRRGLLNQRYKCCGASLFTKRYIIHRYLRIEGFMDPLRCKLRGGLKYPLSAIVVKFKNLGEHC